MTREEFQTRRAKIEKEMEAVSRRKEVKLSKTRIDLDLDKDRYAEIKKYLALDPFNYRDLALNVSHKKLADYLHHVLQEITIEDAAVTSVTLKNGIKLKFEIAK